MKERPLQRVERRASRSANLTEALRLQLRRSASLAGIQSLALADRDGLVLASSRPDPMCEEIAAVCRFLGSAGTYEGPLPAASGRVHASVHRFGRGPTSLYLCAVGGRTAVRGVEIHRAIRGIERILS
jgi:hypothetical protein